MSDTSRTVPIPLGNRVILVKDEAPTETAGGIHLPEDSREKPLLAHIVAISDEVGHKGGMSVGDDVVYASFAGTEFLIDDVEVIVVDADDIMIVLREEEPLPKIDGGTRTRVVLHEEPLFKLVLPDEEVTDA